MPDFKENVMNSGISPSKLLVILIAVVTLAGSAGACTAAVPVTAPSGKSSDSSNGSSAQPGATVASVQENWDRIVAAAKKEGAVRIYTSGSGPTTSALTAAFKQRYGLDAEYVTARPPELLQKVLSERRAGLYLADVFIGGGSMQVVMLKPDGLLDPLEPALILPEVADPKMWLDAQIPFFDTEHTSIGFVAIANRYMLRNTEMVKPEEIKSYRELTRPQWKGKLVLQDANLGGSGLWFITLLSEDLWGREETLAFLKELKKLDVAITNDVRLQVEWVARGKYALAVAPRLPAAYEFMNVGAPISLVRTPEGSLISRSGGGVSLASKAAHPNAAIVFVNWLLSQEGQTVYNKADLSPSARLDVSKEGLDPSMFPDPGEKIYKEDEKFILATPKLLAAYNEIFTPPAK